ncbi:hypothetical protein V6N12_010368 [Hibiscus sabdariffa]|uniref:RNase H type-1 domain-containing protein n=1 Tax=Hibiscus sabdariffa TaxID=183260 RepID=A0ABR2EJW0_9ROSI
MVAMEQVYFFLGLVYSLSWNDIIFGNHCLDVSQLFFLAKTRLANWYKAKFLKSALRIEELIADPSIDDSANLFGPLGSKGGIEGILRNKDGRVLASISESIGQGKCPLMFIPLIRYIKSTIESNGVILFHVLRAANIEADVLAKGRVW